MRAPAPKSVARFCLLVFFLLFASFAFSNSITIGSLTFVGSGNPNTIGKSIFILVLNTQGVTFDNYVPGIPYALTFNAQVFGWTSVVTTIPPTTIVIDPPHYCPCESAVFTMTLALTGPFRLANSQLFNPNPTIAMLLLPPPGQTYLQPGQTFAIVLNALPSAVPEPSSLLMLATGLIATAVAARRKRRR